MANGPIGDFPSSPGDARSVQSLVGSEVVRIWLPPEVTTSAVAHLEFPTRPLRGAYVVGALNPRGALFVDLQLMDDAVLARAFVRRDPALVVIEFRPGGSPLPDEEGYRGPSDGIVLLEPVGSSNSYPLDVTGYARTFEGHVAAKLVRGDSAKKRNGLERAASTFP